MKDGQGGPRDRHAAADWVNDIFQRVSRRPRQPVWSISIFTGVSPLHLVPQGKAPALTAREIRDVRASFVADPFLLRMREEWLMFFEIMALETGRGEIGYARSVDGLNWAYSGVVLRESFHLSYPHVFESEGDYFMVPETLSQNAIMLYQALRFPFEWKPVAKLIEGCFADATPFYSGGLWWIFACSTPYSNDTLRLYYSLDLKDGWVEHPLSPVIQGNCSIARPGGRVVAFDGRLLRFAQDCDPYYGRRVRAFEITRLSPTDYMEHECSESPVLSPDRGWNGAGMHHVDPHLLESGRWLACVDGHHFSTWDGSTGESLADRIRSLWSRGQTSS